MKWAQINPDNYTESSEYVYSIIENHLEELKQLHAPDGFLSFLNAKPRFNAWYVFDLALTHYMVGNHQEAMDGLRAFETEVAHAPDGAKSYLVPVVDRVMHEIETNPLGLRPLLKEWEDAKIEALGLQPSRTVAAP